MTLSFRRSILHRIERDGIYQEESMDTGRRDFLKTLGIGAASATAAMALPGCGADKPLNFVFFLIDDMGWMDAGCYGSTFYDTPSIDRLAAEGMRFTDAYAACPVCSPTRSSILSGKYPARMILTNWIPGKRPGKMNPPEFLHEMPLEDHIMAEAFKDAGYTTCFVGKWHLGNTGYLPENQGFDINIAGRHFGSPPGYFHPFERKNQQGEITMEVGLTGGKEGEYLTDRLTDESIAFLQDHQEEPFLLYLSHYAVHTPLQAKPELVEKYRKKAANLPPETGPRFAPEGRRENRTVQDHAVYGAMVESMDESVGRIMDTLEELGLDDNTAIIFMSDNGGLSTSEGSPTSNLPLRAGKGWLYEGGIREPMLIKWPGMTTPGSICSEPVTSTDFYPTMLDMAGLPQIPEQHVDGISITPLLTGVAAPKRDALYWHYPHYGNQGCTPGGAIRAGDWKLIEFYEEMNVELYNLADDIGEQQNLSAQYPDLVQELRQKLHEWRQDVDARMPTPNPDYDPVADEDFQRRQRENSRKPRPTWP
jgi:arylsulfatase A-like enzyme